MSYRSERVIDQQGRLNSRVDGPYTQLEASLTARSKRAIKLETSDLAPGGELPLMTRTVPEGEHFQHLRFWDSNQIGADRDPQPPSEDIAEQFQRMYSDTQAFAASSSDQILFSCRGTEPDAIGDVLRDLAAYTTAFPYGPASFGKEPAQVHAGFFGAFAFLQPYVEAYLDALLPKTDENGEPTGEDKQVVVCGHSLGGAIALLVAAYIRSEYTANVMLYTYGMPRAVELPFADHYGPGGREPFTHMRHVHHHDPVPRVPNPGVELNPEQLALLLLGPSAWPAAIRNLVRDYDGEPYAHHGTLVYLPPVRDEDSMPMHGLQVEDLSSLMEILDPPETPGSLDENRLRDDEILGPIEQESLESFEVHERIEFSESIRDAFEDATVETVTRTERPARPVSTREWFDLFDDQVGPLAPITRWYQNLVDRLGEEGQGIKKRAANRLRHLLQDHGLNAYAEVVGRRLDEEVGLYLGTQGPNASSTPAMQETTCSRQYSEITRRIHRLREEIGDARGINESTRVRKISFWKGDDFPYMSHPFRLKDDMVAIRVDIDNLYQARIQVDCTDLAYPSRSEPVTLPGLEQAVGTIELGPAEFVDLTLILFLHGDGDRGYLRDVVDHALDAPTERTQCALLHIPDWDTLSPRFTGENIHVHVSAARRERQQRVRDLEAKLVREINRRNQLCRQQNLFFWAAPPEQRPETDELVRLLQAFKNERPTR